MDFRVGEMEVIEKGGWKERGWRGRGLCSVCVMHEMSLAVKGC